MKTRARLPIRSLAVVLLSAIPGVLAAQDPTDATAAPGSGPQPGEEVMITYETDPHGPLIGNYRRTVKGEFVTMSGGHLVVRGRSGPIVIDTASVRSLRHRVGTKPVSAPAMALGSAGGFVVGFALGALTYRDTSGTSSRSNNGLAMGVLLGAPTGAFVAWIASRSRPIYAEIPLGGATADAAVSPSGRVRLSLAIPAP